MRFTPTALPGVYVIEAEPLGDERGSFARTFCAEDFARHGLTATISQCSVSHNHRAGTLRGMHYQAQPHAEAKLVRCTRGAIFDVALDLRVESPAFRRWVGIELRARELRMLYVPEGCAHGFQTLADDTEVAYQISVAHVPAAARGVRWDDPAFAIAWPLCDKRILSARDTAYPDFV